MNSFRILAITGVITGVGGGASAQGFPNVGHVDIKSITNDQTNSLLLTVKFNYHVDSGPSETPLGGGGGVNSVVSLKLYFSKTAFPPSNTGGAQDAWLKDEATLSVEVLPPGLQDQDNDFPLVLDEDLYSDGVSFDFVLRAFIDASPNIYSAAVTGRPSKDGGNPGSIPAELIDLTWQAGVITCAFPSALDDATSPAGGTAKFYEVHWSDGAGFTEEKTIPGQEGSQQSFHFAAATDRTWTLSIQPLDELGRAGEVTEASLFVPSEDKVDHEGSLSKAGCSAGPAGSWAWDCRRCCWPLHSVADPPERRDRPAGRCYTSRMTGSSTPPRTDGRFPSTLWSEIVSLRDPGDPGYRSRMNRLIMRYWKPVYQAVRVGWTRDDEQARDLTQDFFLRLLGGETLAAADPERGSFRRYLRTVLRHFLVNRKEEARAEKRGGGRTILSLDFDQAGPRPEPSTSEGRPDVEFDRAWAHQLLAEGMAALKRQLETRGDGRAFELFRAYDTPAGERPTYRALAERFEIPDHEVWRTIEAVRAELRTILLRGVMEYVSDERELFRELDELFSL